MSSPTDVPQVLAEIAAVAGWDAAWTLARAKGGQQIFIPARATARHWMTKLIGMEAARAICEHYRAGRGGHLLTLPSGRMHQSKIAMVKALEAGDSANTAAAVSGLHIRTAWRTKKKMREANDLFSTTAGAQALEPHRARR